MSTDHASTKPLGYDTLEDSHNTNKLRRSTTTELSTVEKANRRARNTADAGELNVQGRGANKRKVAMKAMRQHRDFLFDADTNCDGRLSFKEFVSALPKHLREQRPLPELRSWFNLIDSDGSGSVSLNEYFQWSLSAASVVSGAGVIEGFAKFDENGSGHIEEKEFRLAATQLGYGEVAKELFNKLPTFDNHLDYRGLIDKHLKMLERGKAAGIGHEAALDAAAQGPNQTNDGHDHHDLVAAAADEPLLRGFLLSMSWNHVTAEPLSYEEAKRSGWRLAAGGEEELRIEMRKCMRWHTIQLSELFTVMDEDRSQGASMDEFCSALIDLLGYEGPRSVLEETFSAIDADGDGTVTYDELDAWVRGRTIVGSRAVLATLDRGLSLHPTEDEEPWDAERLKIEFCSKLASIDLTIEDVLEACDDMNELDAALSRREFLGHFKRLVDNEMLWYSKVRVAAAEVFDRFDPARKHVLTLRDLARALLHKSHRMASRKVKLAAEAARISGQSDEDDMLWTPETRQYLLDMYSPASRKKVPFDQRLSKPKNRLTFIPAKHLSSVRLPQINEGSPHRQQAAPSTRSHSDATASMWIKAQKIPSFMAGRRGRVAF